MDPRPFSLPPNPTPEQLKAFYAHYKSQLNEKELEQEYKELMEHPETWVSLDEVLRQLAKDNQEDGITL